MNRREATLSTTIFLLQIFIRPLQNLFCIRPLECKIYFAFGPWSAKFILHSALGVQNLFCIRPLECKIYFAKKGVPNLFCEGFRSKFILRRPKLIKTLFLGMECSYYENQIPLVFKSGSQSSLPP